MITTSPAAGAKQGKAEPESSAFEEKRCHVRKIKGV